MAEQRQKAIGYGYIIAFPSGRVILDTLRSNRGECWKSFVGNSTIAKCKAEGFRAVPVWIKEHIVK